MSEIEELKRTLNRNLRAVNVVLTVLVLISLVIGVYALIEVKRLEGHSHKPREITEEDLLVPHVSTNLFPERK